MDSLSYICSANVDEKRPCEEKDLESVVNSDCETNTLEDENECKVVQTCEEVESEDTDDITIIVPTGKAASKTHVAVFSVNVEILYMNNISCGPEFIMADIIWSTVIYPNGIRKNKCVTVELGFQIKSYKIQDATSNRHIIFSVSILNDCKEHFKRESQPFFLGRRGQRADGYLIPIENFGAKETLGNLADERGRIKFRVEMEIICNLTELEKALQFFGWIHIKWMVCRTNQRQWNRVLNALDQEQRRMAESFRIISVLNTLQTQNLQHQTQHFQNLIRFMAELNAISPEKVQSPQVTQSEDNLTEDKSTDGDN